MVCVTVDVECAGVQAGSDRAAAVVLERVHGRPSATEEAMCAAGRAPLPAPACVPAVPDSTEDRCQDPRRNEAREQPKAGEGAARAPRYGGVANGRVGRWWVTAAPFTIVCSDI